MGGLGRRAGGKGGGGRAGGGLCPGGREPSRREGAPLREGAGAARLPGSREAALGSLGQGLTTPCPVIDSTGYFGPFNSLV